MATKESLPCTKDCKDVSKKEFSMKKFPKQSTSKEQPKSSKLDQTKSKISTSKSTEVLLKQRELEIDKLKKHLKKVQDDLKKEVEQRGQSTVSRSGQEVTKVKLLDQLQQLGVSKRRLESDLDQSQLSVKQLQAEMRSLKEDCKKQVTSIQKSSNMEVKKLLEDIRVKDQTLASLSKHHYSDSQSQATIVQCKQIQEEERYKQEKERQEKEKERRDKERNKHEKEKSKVLDKNKEQITSLTNEVVRLQEEMKKKEEEKERVANEKEDMEDKLHMMKIENEKMAETLHQLQEEVTSLTESLNFEPVLSKSSESAHLLKKSPKKSLKAEKTNKKSVRFLLPDSAEPVVNGRVTYKQDMRFLFFDEEEEDEDDTDEKHLASQTKNNCGGILFAEKDTDDNYKILSMELSELQKAYSDLCDKKMQEWSHERDCNSLTVLTLQEKKAEKEEELRRMTSQLDELKDKNEELEFLVLELQENHLQDQENSMQQLEKLKQENMALKQQSNMADTTTTSTSGFEDCYSDEDEVEPMPHDLQANINPNCEGSTPGKDKQAYMETIQNLELRLACGKLRENCLLDKIALLCEEKKNLLGSSMDNEDEYMEVRRSLEGVGGAKSVVGGATCNTDVNEDGELNSVEVERVAAKLKLTPPSDTFGDSDWLEECLKIDTPPTIDYSSIEDSITLTKMSGLEKECHSLKTALNIKEDQVKELQVKIFDLTESDKVLRSMLTSSEQKIIDFKNSLASLQQENENLTKDKDKLKATEENLTTLLDISRTNEGQLRRKLEEVGVDLKEAESRLKKKGYYVEKLEKELVAAAEAYEDKMGELQALLELMKKRNSNLERLCEDLNCKVLEGEKQIKRLTDQLECMELQRDSFVSRIQSLEREKSNLMDKISAMSKTMEKKEQEKEMVAMEISGLRIRLQEIENEKTDLLRRIESQRSVEMIMMSEMEAVNNENQQLREKLIIVAQNKKLSSCGSQTTFDDSYEESSVHYKEYENERMKISFHLSSCGVSNSQESFGSLGDDDYELKDYDYDKYHLPPCNPPKRSRSLGDLRVQLNHKLTQTVE